MTIYLDQDHYSFPYSYNKPINRAGLLLNKNYAIDRHFDHLAFSYVLRGSRGWLKSGNRQIELTPPFALLSLPGEKKSYGPYEKWDEFYFVYSTENFKGLFGGILPDQAENGTISGELIPEVEHYVNIMSELMQKPLTNEVYIQLDSLASLILSLSFWRPQVKESSGNEDLIDAARAYINRNYRENIKLPGLAADFGLSYSNFRRLWHIKFEYSPHKLIMGLRNMEAKELLAATTLPIDDIARQTGFIEQRYFSRFFHKMNNVTASEFRRRYRKNLNLEM